MADQQGPPGPPAPAEPEVGPDGEIIGGPRTMQQIAAQRRLQQTQAQVDEYLQGPFVEPGPAEHEMEHYGEIIGGARTIQIAAQCRLQQAQAQLNEMVVDIMKANVEKVLVRDEKLSELDDRADALQQGASQFEQQAKSLKNKFWLQNLKMMIIMGVIGIVIIGLLFGKYM